MLSLQTHYRLNRQCLGQLFLSLLMILSTPLLKAEATNSDLQTLVDQLKEITQKARQQRAADRWLLNDLEDLVGQFDWPWQDEFLAEDFSDGDYAQDPKWQVTSGQFWIDGRLGLRSRAQPKVTNTQPQRQQDLGTALLGAILQEAMRDKHRDQDVKPQVKMDEPAEIHLALPIPKVFAVKFEFSIHNRPTEQGRMSIGVQQDDKGRYGYRLNLITGDRPFIEVATLQRGQTRVVSSTELTEINNGHSHTIEWRRGPNGNMEIFMDESSLIKARDNSFRDPFKWLTMTNYSGDIAISFVGIHGRK